MITRTNPPMIAAVAVLAILLMADVTSAQDAAAAPNQIQQALSLAPIQKGQVEYSTPAAGDFAQCKIQKIKDENQTGIRVVDPNGLTLREFIFAPESNSICQWRYFRDGIEVYRDIDSNGNKKADNYRWFNTAGTRWGVDPNEDGVIDSWNVISAEEVSAELVAALATGDQARFLRVMPTGAELTALGVGEAKLARLKEKALAAPKNFAQAVQNKLVPEGARWSQFSAIAPSTFPFGTEGSTKDVDYYENAVCTVDAGGREIQMDIGTLIRVGKTWRALDCPQIITAETMNDLASSRVFIPGALIPKGPGGGDGGDDLIAELDKIDQQISEAATSAQLAALHAKRADVLQRMADSRPEEQGQWLRSMADSISGAIQQGVYPDGVARLEALFNSLKESGDDKNLEAYVKFRLMTCEYSQQMSSTVWIQAHAKWLSDLEDFISSYPDSPDTAEAIFQLAMENENSGDDAKALERYNEVVTKFPNSSSATKANGAKTRLQCVGKPLPLVGQLLDGEKGRVLNLANLKGRVTIVYFWTTWMQDPDKEADKIKEILAKNQGKTLTVVGVCLDSDPKAATQFLQKNKITWYQMYEQGGMDSKPANQLGIFSVPTIMVIGKDGNVISRNVALPELEGVVADAL